MMSPSWEAEAQGVELQGRNGVGQDVPRDARK